MKKLVSLVLALVLAMSLCAVSVPASAEGTTEIIYWQMGNAGQKDIPAVMEKLNEQLQAVHPELTLNIQFIQGSEWKDRLTRAMAASERVDMAWMGWHHNIAQEAIDGNILPLDDLLNEYGQDIIASLGQGALDVHRQADGKLYQIISWQGLVGSRAGMFIPTELIEAAGLGDEWFNDLQAKMYELEDNPTLENQQAIYDGIAEYCQGLVEAGKIYKGIDTGYAFTYTSVSAGGSGQSISYGRIAREDDTFTVVATIDNPYLVNHYKNMAEYYDKGYIREDVASAQSNATWVDGLDEQDIILTAHNAWTDNYDVDKTLANGFPTKVLYNRETADFTLGTATGVVIPYTSEEPEAAMKFLNQMYCNKDMYTTFCFGIEGEHYSVEEDGSLKLFGSGVEGSATSQATADWNYGQTCWYLGTCKLLTKTNNPTHNPDWYAKLEEMEPSAYNNPFLRFSFDKTNVETQVAALDALGLEYGDQLNKGYLGVDGWEAAYNTYRDQLYANGLQDVIDEAQAQVNAYVAENGITAWNFADER